MLFGGDFFGFVYYLFGVLFGFTETIPCIPKSHNYDFLLNNKYQSYS